MFKEVYEEELMLKFPILKIERKLATYLDGWEEELLGRVFIRFKSVEYPTADRFGG